MEKMTGESMDLVADNISKIKEMFPEVFTEDKIDFDRLQEVLGEHLDDSKERYRFEWHGKSDTIRLAQTPSTGTLRPCKEESKDWSSTDNLYIEGDNLEVLKLLQKSYNNKVKMIYIDPPYNTGNDFVYKDNFRDNIKNYLEITGQVDSEGRKIATNSDTGGRYHTDWLNMMYSRLRLARNLLTDDGIILISIDDNEIHNLHKICDEIFGEVNFITKFVWEKKKKPSFLNKNLGSKFEYILCYSKNRNNTYPFSVDLTEKGKKYPFNNAGNGERTLVFPPKSCEFNLADGIVKAQAMSEGKIKTSLLNDLEIIDGYNKNEFSLSGEWRYSQAKLDEIIEKEERIIISKIPFRPNHIKEGGEIKKMHNLLTIKHYGVKTNEDADAELSALFEGVSYFDYAKPSELIKLLIKSYTYNDDNPIILDFFSGSATTAQAVMQLNAEDKKKRTSILVQLPEAVDESTAAYKSGYKNICEIGKERIRRAGVKIIEDNKEKDGIDSLDVGFKVFKLDSSNLKKWHPDYDNLELTLDDMISNYVEGRSEEDVLYEIMLKYGTDISLSHETETVYGRKVFIVGKGDLFVCLSDDIDLDVAEFIAKKKNELNPKLTRVVFKDNGFINDSTKSNIIQILKRHGINEVVSV